MARVFYERGGYYIDYDAVIPGAVHTASNATSLRNQNPSGATPVRHTEGGAETGDGGGGFWEFDVASSLDDDIGTVIQAEGVSGRWRRVYSGALDVRWFGAKGDGVNDDTEAIQRAINACLNSGSHDCGGGVYVHPGVYRITSTLRLYFKSINFHGLWFGPGGRPGSVIKWDGAPGVPMLQIQRCSGVRVGNLRFSGNATRRPSSAIDMFVDASDSPVNTCMLLENLWIGGGFSDDGAASSGGVGFVRGIQTSGANLQNDQSCMRGITVSDVTDASIHIGGTQNTNWHLDNLILAGGAVGIRSFGDRVFGRNWNIFSMTTAALDGSNGDGHISVDGFASEGCKKLYRNDGGCGLTVRNGYFQAYRPLCGSDGAVVDVAGGGGTHGISTLVFEDFGISQSESPWTGAALAIKVRHSRLSLSLKNFAEPADYPVATLLDLATDHSGETRVVSKENYAGRFHNEWSHGDSLALDTSRFDIGATPRLPVVATVSLPAAAADMDGRLIIEDAGANVRNLIIYSGATRYRVSGSAF